MPDQEIRAIDFTPAPYDFDVDQEMASQWVSGEFAREHERELGRIQEEVAIEQEIARPYAEQFGFTPDEAALRNLAQYTGNRFERQLSEQAEADGAFGVLEKELPVLPPEPVCQNRTPPFSIESEQDDGRSSSSSFADLADGTMMTRVEANVDGGVHWARCSLGQWFRAHADNYGGKPRCVIRWRSDSMALSGWMATSRIEMMLSVFAFNFTQNRRWLKRHTVFRHTITFGTMLGLIAPNFILGDGYAQFDKGDKVLVTAMLTAYAVAPLGYASINYRGEMANISLCG
ncbi:MAG: hypothetical protein AAF414_24240 [Pseudomonadota bacterium]